MLQRHRAIAMDFHLGIHHIDPFKFRDALPDNEISFQGFKCCYFTALLFRETDEAGNPLDFFDQIDVGQFAVFSDQLAISLQASTCRCSSEWKLDKYFSIQISFQRPLAVDPHSFELASNLGHHPAGWSAHGYI